MTKIYKKFMHEKDFQKYFVRQLVDVNGFVERTDTPAMKAAGESNYDADRALDIRMLMKFLEDTQGETMKLLRKQHGDALSGIIAQKVQLALTQKGGGLLAALKNGIEVSHKPLKLRYPLPASKLNPTAWKLFEKNVYSVAEEVWASKGERVDVVVFLNGLAIASFELKCNPAGQTVADAVKQFKKDRDPKTRLFQFKAGCLVHFAMDLYDVEMTTRLDRYATEFHPFNIGRGEGIHCGKGNPDTYEGDFSVAYMWKDVFTKKTLMEILTKFAYLKIKPGEKGPDGRRQPDKETLIFPRYHQLDCIRRVLGHVKDHKTDCNYLIQHSAGSGKTNTIAWLAYRLASLYDAHDQNVFDKVIVMTDRIVVDSQLQKALYQLDHQDGQIVLIDKEQHMNSSDLKKAMEDDTKIIGSTIQLFPFVLKLLPKMKARRFAVIIDEAHSSTAGITMQNVTKLLGAAYKDCKTPEEILEAELKGLGKQDNVSMFAFTATPKPETLQLFGRETPEGPQAFHLYSMKQAIDEGYILDVLENYIEYKSLYKIVKKVQDDPLYKQKKAAALIVKFAMLHPEMIAQRTAVIVEHFRSSVMSGLGCRAKAMVVTSGIEEAIRYKWAFDAYLKEQGYTDTKALVAFSGKKKVDGHEYSEPGMNGFSEKKLPEKFEKIDENRFLIVADKYQTGFDQPLLSAMYVMKKLTGIAAVQTLSRLNRICPGYDDKKTFVLDFTNTVEDMEKAFAPYYEGTILKNQATVEQVYALMEKINEFNILDQGDVDKFWRYACRDQDSASQKIIAELLKKARDRFEELDEAEQIDALRTIRRFVKSYDFIVQAAFLKDEILHKRRAFLGLLLPSLDEGNPHEHIDLRKKIDAVDIGQKKVKETAKSALKSKPDVYLKEGGSSQPEEDLEEKLSKIIEAINVRTGQKVDSTQATLGAKQFIANAAKSVALHDARRFPPDQFDLVYQDEGKGILANTYEDNKKLFGALLSDSELFAQFLSAVKANVMDALDEGDDVPRQLDRSAPRILRDIGEELKYRSWLPVYSLRAACGPLADGEVVDPEGWVNAEGYGKLDETQFVVKTEGVSMEGLIPEGSYAIFRKLGGGNLAGKTLLIQRNDASDPEAGGAYTVKRFTRQGSQVVLKATDSKYDIVLRDEAEYSTTYRALAEFKEVLR